MDIVHGQNNTITCINMEHMFIPASADGRELISMEIKE
jgi:hypothetical protein